MLSVRVFVRGSIVLTTAAVLTACAQHGAETIPAVALASPANASRLADPPACKGQKNSKDHATLRVTLSTKGGLFCVPEFGGFGGTISYPTATPSVKATVISSTTDYKQFPQLGKGTAIFYLQLALTNGTTFGSGVRPDGGITAQIIQSGKTYTAFGQATIGSSTINFGPCYSTATKGKYGGVIGSVGALLEDGSASSAATAVIEIYSGKQTKTPC